VRIAADDVAGHHPIITELPQPRGAVTALALDALLENLYVGTADGQVVHVALSETESPEMRAAYTVAASFDSRHDVGVSERRSEPGGHV
jgi:phosphate transport system permease protein